LACHQIIYLDLDDINLIRYRLKTLDNNIGEDYISFGNLTFILYNIQNIYDNLEFEDALVSKAAYLFQNLIIAHIFPDGNKRTAFVALLTFLRKNRRSLNITQQEGFTYTLNVYNNSLPLEDIISWIRHKLITR
jgi:death on curing protein